VEVERRRKVEKKGGRWIEVKWRRETLLVRSSERWCGAKVLLPIVMTWSSLSTCKES
jgi:hypothetical protein